MWRVWTVATSPGGALSSKQQFLKECAPTGDVVTVHAVFAIYATHAHVNYTLVMPFSPQKIALILKFVALHTSTTVPVTCVPSSLRSSHFYR